ncbi:MAG: NAD-dependent epimerase/dehydratase family protein [Nitrospirae bacterium]|nr:NAD-dependent epimerase/dehydratase family protein [Nitrospirota bacterium]
MKIANSRFLITGGSGFVGSHLTERLLERGAERVVLYDKAVRRENLAGLQREPRVEVIEGDVLDPHGLARALKGVNGVFHMAVLPLGACEKDPALAFEVNIRGTFTVIAETMKAGAGKIVYSSASSVYGDTPDVMDERHPFDPWTMYGVSKLCGEFLFRPFQTKLPYAIVRYMNVYGPRQGAGLIPAVLTKIQAGQPPVINGDGSASFDFVHVRDVARCTMLAMERDITAEAFNVGSGTEATVKEIVAMLLELTGSSLEPVYNLDAQVPMTRRVGSHEKAKRLLGFEAAISLRQGLEELVKEANG